MVSLCIGSHSIPSLTAYFTKNIKRPLKYECSKSGKYDGIFIFMVKFNEYNNLYFSSSYRVITISKIIVYSVIKSSFNQIRGS